MRIPKRRVLIVPLVLAVSACTDQLPTELDIDPQFEIADAARAYKSGFYWLSPLVAQPAYSGTFDATVSPTVEICEVVDNACGQVVGVYTMAEGAGGELVRVSLVDEHYHVNWHTNEFELDITKFYRVSVRAGIRNVLLGYADVQPVNNGSGLKNIDTGEYIGLVDGRTLPIKFRIETGIVGQVDVEPIEATATPGGTQQFIAIVRDLHGEIMNADVVWGTSDENVARVDQTGLATATADGSALISATAERVTGIATLDVAGGVVVGVATGFSHSCVITEAAKAYCWGANDRGQLGNGTTVRRPTPTAVAGGLAFDAITAGQLHTCGIATGGQAYCWGEGFGGLIGNGSTQSRSTPTAVSGTFTFASISAGGGHTCAITTAQRAFCWGNAFSGQLGNGIGPAPRTTPTAVSGNRLFAVVESGYFHTCAITTTGQAFCWGAGVSGQLGNGLFATRTVPELVLGGRTYASITAGDLHSCAITTAGEAYCWGQGTHGRLGNDATTNSAVPVRVSGNLLFTKITAGETHTCGITTTGQGYCWGSNDRGQLGTGTVLLTARTPVPVAGGHVFTAISAGAFTTCAVSTDGQTYCWGNGELGNGAFNSRAPVPVGPLQ